MNEITNAADALKFLTGGNATFTLTSNKTGQHFTFKAQKPTVETDNGGKRRDHDAEVVFIKVLTGDPNNWQDWQFLGTLFLDSNRFIVKRGTSVMAPSVKAFGWTLQNLKQGEIPASLTIQHSGNCCRCGRTLTHPESIDTGIGPECRKHFA